MSLMFLLEKIQLKMGPLSLGLFRAGCVLGLLCSPFVTVGQELVDDPYRYPVSMGDRTVLLEDWVQLPDTSGLGGGPGAARLNIMRHLDDGRLFINDQRGMIYEISKDHFGVYLSVLNRLDAFIDTPGLGAGLHAFAFHPEFLDNGKLYTVHTEPVGSGNPDMKGPNIDPTDGGVHSVILEWTDDNPGSTAFFGGFREVLRIHYPGPIHTMQEIAFNPFAEPGDEDYGLLYVLSGEGQSYSQGFWENQQRLDSPLGTVLRIDPRGNDSVNGQYGIPETNPWFDVENDSVLREIYAIGFRNPHRITWSGPRERRAYIGDIGEDWVEEINLLVPGGNYGFPHREGTFLLKASEPENNHLIYELPENDAEEEYLYPVAQYIHFPNTGNAIALGEVYRGDELANILGGQLLFSDLHQGRIFSVTEWELEQGRQQYIEEFRIRLDGSRIVFRQFFNGGRSDLRMGRNSDGDIFIFTKTDGMVRKVVGVERSGSGIFSGQRGFRFIDPFGWIDDASYPWVYFVSKGWKYFNSESASGFWVYSLQDSSWHWSSAEIFPKAYDLNEGWLLR